MAITDVELAYEPIIAIEERLASEQAAHAEPVLSEAESMELLIEAEFGDFLRFGGTPPLINDPQDLRAAQKALQRLQGEYSKSVLDSKYGRAYTTQTIDMPP